MGNEYGAADLQPHLMYGNTVTFLIVGDGTTETTVLAGGYHQKMRLRQAYMMVVNAALGTADVAIDIKHGGSDVVAAQASGSTTSPIGDVTDMTIDQQYVDLDPDEALTYKNDSATTGDGDILVFLTYEIVE